MNRHLQGLIEGIPSEDDFIAWGAATRRFVTDIVSRGPRFLGDVVRQALDIEGLRGKCETHQLLDYLVLHDDPATGLRLRLHVSTEDHLQRVHDHRFSFSSHVMRGRYEHCIYRAIRDPYEVSPAEHAIAFQDKRHTDPHFEGRAQDELFTLQLYRAETVGACYTMRHSVCHTVFTSRDTVSLVARGRARKQRSYIYDREQQSLWWRFGREDETATRVQDKIMSDDKVTAVLQNLQRLDILA